jgi:hypothetical protein
MKLTEKEFKAVLSVSSADFETLKGVKRLFPDTMDKIQEAGRKYVHAVRVLGDQGKEYCLETLRKGAMLNAVIADYDKELADKVVEDAMTTIETRLRNDAIACRKTLEKWVDIEDVDSVIEERLGYNPAVVLGVVNGVEEGNDE